VLCDAPVYGTDGGCTGDINLIPNFATAHDVTITGNLFRASPRLAYCTYGGDRNGGTYPNGNHIVYRDNVFERGANGKCGAYGPVSSFNPAGVGNVWTGNTWSDGTPVSPN
jgi:hypothetical protein